MAAAPVTAKAYQSLIARWPKDPIRPTVSFAKALEARASKVAEGDARTKKEIGVLSGLLADAHKTKYPLSPSFTKPSSSPNYYIDLVKELEEAPSRSWFDRKVQSWKGFLRFS